MIAIEGDGSLIGRGAAVKSVLQCRRPAEEPNGNSARPNMWTFVNLELASRCMACLMTSSSPAGISGRSVLGDL